MCYGARMLRWEEIGAASLRSAGVLPLINRAYSYRVLDRGMKNYYSRGKLQATGFVRLQLEACSARAIWRAQ